MPVIRDLPLAASLPLVALALFLGGGASDGSLWVARRRRGDRGRRSGGPVGLPRGWLSLAPFAALVAWLALSISWSWLPRRSWDYADRGLVYLLFAVLGLWLAGRTRPLAVGLCALLGAVALWALLGKVLPSVYDYGPPGVARLRGPVGLWNQLALLGDFALPLALWRKRLQGTLLAFLWLVALVLTYSRGGLATAVLVIAAFLVLTDDRWESAATLVAAAVPAAVVVGIAFALPGVTSDGESSATRWRDGLIFGAVLLAGAGAAAFLSRVARPRDTPALRRVLAVLGVLALAGLVAVAVVKAGSFGSDSSVGNSAGRFGSGASNFRTVVVAPGLGRVAGAQAHRHRRRHLPPDESPLPRLVPRRDDRAARPAAAVPVRDRPRGVRSVPRRVRGAAAAARGGATGTSSHLRSSCPRT